MLREALVCVAVCLGLTLNLLDYWSSCLTYLDIATANLATNLEKLSLSSETCVSAFSQVLL